MKKIIILLIIITVFFSCKSIPQPKNESDSLIIGSVIWDFPDGFFQLEPKTISNNILLGIVNLNTGEQFKLKTSDGHFNFLCNGNDKFMLQYISYKSPGGAKIYTIGYEMNLQITSKPKRIIYVGHIKVTFASPEISEAKEGDAMISTYWRFREKHIIENKIEEAKEYLAENDKENLWQNYKIFNMYEN